MNTALEQPDGQGRPGPSIQSHFQASVLLSGAFARFRLTDDPPVPILLAGPLGCGKSQLIRDAAKKAHSELCSLSMSRWGGSASQLEEGVASSAETWPCALHIYGAGPHNWGPLAAFLASLDKLSVLRQGQKMEVDLRRTPIVVETNEEELATLILTLHYPLGGRFLVETLSALSSSEAKVLLRKSDSPVGRFVARMAKLGVEIELEESFLDRLCECEEFCEMGMHSVECRLHRLELEILAGRNSIA